MNERKHIDTSREDTTLYAAGKKNSWIYTLIGLILCVAALYVYAHFDPTSLLSLGLLLIMLFAGVACLYTGYGLRKDERKSRQDRH